MGFPPGSTIGHAVYHRVMARDPMRALVGARAVNKRAGAHAPARAVGDERDAEAIERRARERRDAAAQALAGARDAARALITGGADAGAIARAEAYIARRRRNLSEAEVDLARAAGSRAAAAAVTGV